MREEAGVWTPEPRGRGLRCGPEELGEGRVLAGTHHTSTITLADPSAAVATSRNRLPNVRARGLVSSSPRLGSQGWIFSAFGGVQSSTSRNVTWSLISSGGGGPVTARAHTLESRAPPSALPHILAPPVPFR